MSLGRMVCLDDLKKCFGTLNVCCMIDDATKMEITNRIRGMRGFENATVDVVYDPESRQTRAYVDGVYMVTHVCPPTTIEELIREQQQYIEETDTNL